MPSPRTDSNSSPVNRLYASEVLSGLGDGVFWVGILTAIAGEGDFDTLLVLAILVRLGPRALLSLPGGSLADRVDVRVLLVVCEAARALIMTVVGIALASGMDVIWVFPGVLVAYVIGVPVRPAIAASLPSLVAERELAQANAMVGTIRQVMTFIGPLVGVAVAVWSPAAAFVVNGVSFALSAVLIASIERKLWPNRRGRSSRSQSAPVRSAARVELGRIDGFPLMVALTGVMYFVRGTEVALHVLVVRDLLDARPSSIGYLSGAVGLGAIAAMPFVRRAASGERSAATPILVSMGLTAVPLVVLAAVGSVTTASLLMVPMGAGMVLFEVISVITVQRTVPASDLGRAFGAVHTSANAAKLLGAVVTPVVAGWWGTEETLLIVAALVVVGGVVVVAPLRSVSRNAERRRAEVAPIVAVLEQLEIFRDGSQLALERLAQQLVAETLEAGDVLIEEGAMADDLFVIRSGEFDVSVDGAVVNHVGAGTWAGEIGLVEGLPRTATVEAVTDALVWRIPGRLFLEVLSGLDDTSALDGGIDVRLSTGRSSRSY